MGEDVKSCALCLAVVKKDDFKELVQCVVCSNTYHDRCVSDNLRGFHKKKRSWKCSNCVEFSAENVPVNVNDEATAVSDDGLSLSVLMGCISKLVFEVASLNNKVDILLENNQLLSAEIKTLKNEQVMHNNYSQRSDNNYSQKCAGTSESSKPDNDNKSTVLFSDERLTKLEPIPLFATAAKGNRKNEYVNPVPGSSVAGDEINTKSKINGINKREEFTVVSHKKKKIIRGTLKDNQSVIKSADRQSFVYAGNLHVETTIEDMNTYLKSKLPNEQFSVEKLPKREEAKSVSFKITVNSTLYSTLMNASFWEMNVIVKKFHFFRKKENASNTSEAQLKHLRDKVQVKL